MSGLTLLGVSKVAAAFTPLSLSPYVLLDPDTFGLTNGQSVATAIDTSGSARDFTQATPEKPTFAAADLNGRGSIVHAVPGNPQWLAGPDISALTSGHVFIVIKTDGDPPPSANSGLWTLAGAANTSNTHYPYSDGTVYESFGATVRKTVGNPTPSLASWRIYEVRSAAGDWEAKLDGASLFSTATNTVAFPTAPELGRSNQGSGIYPMEGRWAWFGLFPALSSGDATAVRTYLQSRFAL